MTTYIIKAGTKREATKNEFKLAQHEFKSCSFPTCGQNKIERKIGYEGKEKHWKLLNQMLQLL